MNKNNIESSVISVLIIIWFDRLRSRRSASIWLKRMITNDVKCKVNKSTWAYNLKSYLFFMLSVALSVNIILKT